MRTWRVPAVEVLAVLISASAAEERIAKISSVSGPYFFRHFIELVKGTSTDHHGRYLIECGAAALAVSGVSMRKGRAYAVVSSFPFSPLRFMAF
jgi:hypothetical protein